MKMPTGARERHTKNVSRQQGGSETSVIGMSAGGGGSKMAKKASYDLWMIP